jgi:2-keto-4-pentenoate hydratase/2-oxohepta-3-ene-1,7-dioic acid hydratase in catechol pathway
MRFISYRHGGREGYGVVQGDRVAPLSNAEAPTLRTAMAQEGMAGLQRRASKAHPTLSLGDLEYLPPITHPGKFICVGLNYQLHAKEANMAVPPKPSLFVRYADSVTGHEQPVMRPPESEHFDYEAELAVVIGGDASGARRVPQDKAMALVAGYTCLAENSLRDWQRHSAQATPGKNFVHSGAIGPWLVTADEIGDPKAMEVIGVLNGVEVQRDSVANMIFSLPEIVSYITSFTTLYPGDVIATGTPAGVGMGKKPPVWLKAGDVFEVTITGIGTLRNAVADEISNTEQ